MIFDTRDNVSLVLRVIAVALAIAILITGGLAIAIETYFGKMSIEGFDPTIGNDIDSSQISEGGNFGGNYEEEPEQPVETPDPNDEEHFSGAETIEPDGLKNLKDLMKSWINTGGEARDEDVINILVIGMENAIEGNNNISQPLDKNGRADAMCILSINKRTKTITLASILRDQYAAIPIGNKIRYSKFHHALSYAGERKQVEMIERYYKVVIDNYVIVNFDSVIKIIDIIGGVDIELTKNEADYLKNTCGWNIKAEAQKLRVDGGHALTYMRIRKKNTGGDEARTGRQRKVMMNIIEQTKNLSVGQIMELANAITPYVRTTLQPTEIIAYAITAVTEGWLNYEVKQVMLPDSECCKSFKNPADGGSYWKVDYPVAAQKLQMALFGKTNIVLKNDRDPWI